MKKNKKGFTLIELLVVIAIIGLLATLSVIALNTARMKARDARRVSDVKQIQTALEMYFDSNAAYPSKADFDTPTKSLKQFINVIPVNPSPQNDSGCTGFADYVYAASGTPVSTYTLTYCLSTQSSPSGTLVATPAGIR